MQLKTGQMVFRAGYFTKARYFRGVAASEVERRAGYRSGRLGDGWYLLFMMRIPAAAEFEFRGYSQMSGGVARGHLDQPPDPRNAEQQLRESGYDLARLKAQIIGDHFRTGGPDRLAKVVPVRGEFGAEDYPPGSGIPQWELVKRVPFRVAAFVPPRGVYSGSYM